MIKMKNPHEFHKEKPLTCIPTSYGSNREKTTLNPQTFLKAYLI